MQLEQGDPVLFGFFVLQQFTLIQARQQVESLRELVHILLHVGSQVLNSVTVALVQEAVMLAEKLADREVDRLRNLLLFDWVARFILKLEGREGNPVTACGTRGE